MKYSCGRCLKEFSQKSHYNIHLNKKRPCQDNKSKIDKVVEEINSDNIMSKSIENTLVEKVQPDSVDPHNLLDLLNKILKTKDYKVIADELNVAVGTVKRWNELKNVPPSYCFELMRLADIKIDYTNYTFKDKDQFFTPSDTVNYCVDTCKNILKKYGDIESEYIYIEPSAGNGKFLDALPDNRRIGIDIEPRSDGIITGDYLNWKPAKQMKYIVIGNPPFGLRGQLALKFINHSYNFADYVCFILPQLFESDGKGVPRKRVIGYNLIHSEKLNTDFEEPNGKPVKVECIYQIWSKNHKNPDYDIKQLDTSVVKIYSLSDGGSPSTTRNKKMFDKCDIYLPSTCFGKENMRFYKTFKELPRQKGYGIVFNKDKNENMKKFKEIDWSKVAFLSTNSAYNIRTSQISEQFS